VRSVWARLRHGLRILILSVSSRAAGEQRQRQCRRAYYSNRTFSHSFLPSNEASRHASAGRISKVGPIFICNNTTMVSKLYLSDFAVLDHISTTAIIPRDLVRSPPPARIVPRCSRSLWPQSLPSYWPHS